MKKLRANTAVKILAIVLLTIMALAFVASAVSIFGLYDYKAYEGDYDLVEERVLNQYGNTRLYIVTSQLFYSSKPENIDPGNNFAFNVYDKYGRKVFDGLGDSKIIWQGETAIWNNSYGNVDSGSLVETPKYLVYGYLTTPLVANSDLSFTLNLVYQLYQMRYALIAYLIVSFILGVSLFIFLMCAAGHRKDKEEITENFIDKIPFDVFTLAVGAALAILLSFTTNFGWYRTAFDLVLLIIGTLVLIALGGLLLLMFFMSFATRVKLGTVIKSCLIYRIFVWCWRFIKKAFTLFVDLIKALPLLGRSAAIMAVVLVVEMFFVLAGIESGVHALYWFFTRLVLVPVCIFALLGLQKLRAGAKEIANGNDSYHIDTKHMRGEILAHAQDLNNISEGLEKAVEERMKSEHFKTELITNVSHDIKTPLTSIINYVDLLAKEEPENEKSREYIEVLARQSARLKKLIEDLMDASKASTGNVAINLERCVLGVLLDQAAGEYGEKLTEAGLDLVLTKPANEVAVMADSRHIWRVFDNLMNNACKYSMPGTRVYLSLEKKGEEAVVQFRNISKSQLNISGDELMERFVRGDSSRNTEGSGLGLAIARSLAELQNCKMDLSVDGDLFKVILKFKAL